MSESPIATPDWSQLPAPQDDGAARHLSGAVLPDIALPATGGGMINPARLKGLTVFYLYPMTGRPDRALPEGWNDIPGARGCTPQSCAFRDHHEELRALGAAHVFGISTQTPDEQAEAAARLHLPFALLSDHGLAMAEAMRLPVMEVEGRTMLRRLTMIAEGGRVVHVRYPVFPPDSDAPLVAEWLRDRRA